MFGLQVTWKCTGEFWRACVCACVCVLPVETPTHSDSAVKKCLCVIYDTVKGGVWFFYYYLFYFIFLS